MAEYNLGRVAFFDKGAYSPEETYNKWEFVTTVDSTYLFIGTTPQIGKPVTDANFWKCIANGKPATLAAAAVDLAKEAANNAAILAADKAGLADSKATLANEKAAIAQSAADNANAKAAEVTSAVLSAGQLGPIKPTDAAPTPARNGNYTFSIGGAKPAWLTAEPLVTTVKAGDGVAVVYTEPSTYSYTHVDVSSDFITIQELKAEIADLYYTDNSVGNKFVKELYVSGSIVANKIYFISAVARNHTTYKWSIIISEKNADGTGKRLVCYLSSFPTEPTGVFDIPQYLTSGISAKIVVDWSQIGDNTNNSVAWTLLDKSFNYTKSPQIYSVIDTYPAIAVVDNKLLGKLDASDFFAGDRNIYYSPKGASEYLGNATYSNSVTKGLCMFMQMSAKTLFNKIQFTGAVTIAGTTVYIRLSKNTVNNVVTATTIVELTQIWDTDATKMRSIVLSQPITLKAGEFLIVQYSSKSVGNVKARYWDGSVSGDNRGTLGSTQTTDYNNIFITGWSQGITSYGTVPFILDIETPYHLKTTPIPPVVVYNAYSDIKISISDKIYAVVGDTLQLYYRGIINAPNPYEYDIQIECAKGKSYPRYFEYTPTSGEVGTVSFNIKVVFPDATYIEKTCSLITVAVPASPVTQKNILLFGSSEFNNPSCPVELSRRLIGTGGSPVGLALSNVAVTGRQGTNPAGYEGTGGWSWSTYIGSGVKAVRFTVNSIVGLYLGATYTAANGAIFVIQEINVTAGSGNIRCIYSSSSPNTNDPSASGTLTKTSGSGDDSIAYSAITVEQYNPFYNISTGHLDITSYVNQYCNGSLAFAGAMQGFNEFGGNIANIPSTVANAKTLIRQFHTEYPNLKFILMGTYMPDVRGGCGANYNATGAFSKRNLLANATMRLNDAYQSLANETEFSGYVIYISLAAQVDCENVFPYSNIAVSNRMTDTEKLGTNAMHPTSLGLKQFADAVYRAICANLS